MLSKRILAQSFYETICPQCSFRTPFTASQIVQREFQNYQTEKIDYGVIDYNIKCQVCLNKFRPTRHRTCNFFKNPIKAFDISPIQQSYICSMKSFIAGSSVGAIRLAQKTEEMKYLPKFDGISIFLVDEVQGQDGKVRIVITGHNLSSDLLKQQLGVFDIMEIPVSEAVNFHVAVKPQMVGDVSHVTRT